MSDNDFIFNDSQQEFGGMPLNPNENKILTINKILNDICKVLYPLSKVSLRANHRHPDYSHLVKRIGYIETNKLAALRNEINEKHIQKYKQAENILYEVIKDLEKFKEELNQPCQLNILKKISPQ